MFEDYRLFDDGEDGAEVNMGPLIDMVFILLIFFIITTNFTRQTGIEVSKPKAQTAVSQGQEVMLVGITREGTLHVYGRQITVDQLKLLVARQVSRQPDLSVVIVADQQAPIGKAVRVMDQCSLTGVRNVSVAADKE
ncbi:MAG: ExbD/TolR family protein [Fibrobacterota bacterium]